MRNDHRGVQQSIAFRFVVCLLFFNVSHAIRILPTSRLNTTKPVEEPRRLQSVYVEPPKSPDDHLVGDLPLQQRPFPTHHWAGHLPASSSHDKYFFYWLFAPEAKTPEELVDVPILIWLNGGPACSSMDGLFIENGPLRLTRNPQTNAFELTYEEHSWHKAPAYTLYIDQPVGTGLSFTTSKMYPRNDAEVNTDIYYFLQQFFQLHSDKFVSNGVLNRNLFFSGESYAGHYIPSIMNYMMKRKDTAIQDGEISLPVRGAAIGNGWVDPFYQYAGAEFAYGHGLIDMSQRAAFQEQEKQCQAKLNKEQYNVNICFKLIDDIISQSHGSNAPTKASGYDIRVSEKAHAARDFPPGHKVVETYLGGHALPSNEQGTMTQAVWQQVLEAIHATAATDAHQTYEECTDPPYNALAGSDGLGVVDDVVELLEHPDKVELLFFNGIYDIICNHVGNERFLEKLPWKHNAEWFLEGRYAWFATSSSDSVSGYMKEFENLKFLKIMDAGHMVPMDVPEVAFQMIRTFMKGESFKDYGQNLDLSKEQDSCPVCPTCYERDSGAIPTQSSSYSRPDSANGQESTFLQKCGAFAIQLSGLVIGSFVTALYFRRKYRRSSGYDLELRQLDLDGESDEGFESRGSYEDEPSGYGSKTRVV